ncbi:hypothetical protein V8C26DRAFT_81774 [Trichoderma gracile]
MPNLLRPKAMPPALDALLYLLCSFLFFFFSPLSFLLCCWFLSFLFQSDVPLDAMPLPLLTPTKTFCLLSHHKRSHKMRDTNSFFFQVFVSPRTITLHCGSILCHSPEASPCLSRLKFQLPRRGTYSLPDYHHHTPSSHKFPRDSRAVPLCSPSESPS